MPMKNVSVAAVEQIRRQSADTAETLRDNMNKLQTVVDPYLAQWKDAHVNAYHETASSIANDIQRYNNVLAAIEDFCRRELDWIHEYLDT